MSLIDGSDTDYITPSGQIYKDYGNDKYFPKKNIVNNVNGYLYCGISMKEGYNKSHRVHVLVAKAFLPNPNNLPCVCHIDNNKQNPCLENLRWGTVSENTRDAYRDGLARNAKGYEDSQSMPVYQLDENGNIIKDFGSVSEAARATGMMKRSITYQCWHEVKTKPRKGYYFRFQKEYDEKGFVL